MKRELVLLSALLGGVSAVQAVTFNTDALKQIQDEGLKIADSAKNARAFRLQSGKCLHAQGDLTRAGGNVVIVGCNNSANQKWSVDPQGRLVNVGGKCLGLAGPPKAPGVNAVLQVCSNAPGQKWRIDGASRLVNAAGQCLQAAGDIRANGTNVAAAQCVQAPRQVWK